MRSIVMILAFLLSVTVSMAQGLIVSEMRCYGTYRGVSVQGVIQLQLYLYAGSAGAGHSFDRTMLNMMIKEGRAAEIPGTLVLNGEFIAPGTIVHIEAPNMIGGQGTGAIVFNGQVHRATYATFYLVAGGLIVVTEDRERVDYRCQ